MKEDAKILWHALDSKAIFQELNSTERGLEEQEVKKRLKSYGPNILHFKTTETIPRIFLRQLHSPIVYVLIASALLALVLGKWMDSIVVFSVVALNTLIGFIQEFKAHKTIKSLTSMIPQQTTVVRNNDAQLVASPHIVPGDVVSLQAGDRISADIRLFFIKNLQCDESVLTGESLPMRKRIEPSPPDALLPERRCMAFNGTFVTSGTGLGIVVTTGVKTEFGKISELIEQVHALETPLSLTIRKATRWITMGVLLISIALFIIGYLRGSHFFDAGLAAIALAVAAIPEGLPAIVTITSSIGVRRMARKQAIIRQLPAVEALGSTTIICTDKTGTLTGNEMTVQRVWTPSGDAFVSGAGYALEGDFFSQGPLNHREIDALLKAGILCSDASLDENPTGWIPIGDPTEIALVVAGRKKGLLEDTLRRDWKRIDLIPFEPERKIMATLNVSPDNQYCLFIKGAPEEILSVCTDIVDAAKVLEHVSSMAKEGMRIIAVAKKKLAKGTSQIREEEIKSGCTFLGLAGITDPPRKEVYQALKSCREAGITIKMITGDHPITAEAIAKGLGLLGHGKVIMGQEINHFTEEDWQRIPFENHVFARVSPEHKLKLVEAFQRAGHVVAMTGDGVNDAPALKQADIGIAMGIRGTAVSKEASDMILADDNFASIEAAVEEGRHAYDNLIKSLAFVLPTSLGQSLVIFFAVLFLPLEHGQQLHPMSPVQILWVNLVVAVALSLSLAFEPPEPNIMKQPPRKKSAPIFNGFLFFKIFTVSILMAISTILLFLWNYHTEIAKGTLQNTALSEAQTTAVTTIMLFQIFYLFHCRSLRGQVSKLNFLSNPYVFLGVGIVLFAQTAFIYMPLMNRLFHSSSLNFQALLICILVAFLIVPIMALERFFRRKLKKK